MGLKSDLLSGTSVLSALAQAAHFAPGSGTPTVAEPSFDNRPRSRKMPRLRRHNHASQQF